MPSPSRPLRRVLLVYAALSLALWPLPLLNRLHAESSAVVACVAFFAAGLAALAQFRAEAPFWRVLTVQLGALLVPLGLLAVAMLWAPNCDWRRGLLLFSLFPGVTVVLAVAVAYALAGLRLRRKRLALVGLGVGIAVFGPLYDLGLHPQFYTYNHVFGGVLGPIYDEDLALRPGLFAFRALTLLWAAFAYLVGRRLHHPWATRLRALPVVGLLIGLCYLSAGWLGINTPAWQIQRTLGAIHRTAHFDIYYDPASVTAAELRHLAADHEYRYAQLADRLGIAVDARIASYLYPDADTKARLTGARTTNVAPVWLPRPQAHVLLPAYEQVFAHELAHVFSREFGLPVLNASVAVGLVEGLAEALEPPDGRPSGDEQVAVALAQGTGLTTALPEALAARLSPYGFWTDRGAVSYTTTGSFVRYLLDTYGPEPLRAAYAWARFEDAYGKPVEALAEEWAAALAQRTAVDAATDELVGRRFTIPSLLERRCPHYVPPYVRATRAADRALVVGDTTAALAGYADALGSEPRYGPALAGWALLGLATGTPEAVAARLDTLPAPYRTPTLALLLGDARALQGNADAARATYAEARTRLPAYATASHARLLLRTAVADEPAVLHVLHTSLPPAEQARRLADWPSAPPAARWIEALLWAAAEQPEQALGLLRTVEAPADRVLQAADRLLLERQRLLWLGRLSYRAGAPGLAAAYATAAAHSFEAADAPNRAAAAYDQAAFYRWLEAQPPRPVPALSVLPAR